MECVCPILETIGGYLVSPIMDQLGFLFNYNEVIEAYRNQLEKLGNKREDVQQLVDVARTNGEEIRINVTKWLAEVDDIIVESSNLDERINTNKGCLNGWCPDWISMYKLSKEVKKITSIVMQLQGDVPRENVSLPTPPPCVDLISNKDFVTAVSSKSTMDQIMELLQDDGCDIIGVYGMGGIGKTTLVKEVGKKAKKDKLFDKIVMSVVSQNPDLRKIQGQIADMLGLQFSAETERGRADQLYARLKNEERIFIILDDVWATIDLEEIGIPHGVDRPGCKVIITTRRESVCSAMGSRTKKICVSLLSVEESWNLFREKAGNIVDSSMMLNAVAMDVAKECGGLPLALVTVGSALRDKEELEEWKSALQRLKKSTPLTMDESEQCVFSCIKLSYDYIKTDEIKMLFLFCCLFPEDYEIAIETLARFGMGKGLFTDTDIIDTMDDARSRAHDVIKYLKASCLLLDCSWEGNVKMHDVVRDVGSIVSREKDNSFLIRAGVGLKEWPNKETFEHYTAISLMVNDIQKLPGGLNCPNLQILLLGMNERLEEIPDAFFKGMPALRVLDLGGRQWLQSLQTLPPSFELLAQLRTLRLDWCKLSSSISILGKLRKLEILSLARSYIEELPKEIGELINLRLLDLSRCKQLQKIPANVISSLTQLEELYMGGSFMEWAVEGTEEEKTSACISELKSLPRLLILRVDLKNISCFPRQLLLQNLLKYHISIGYMNSEIYAQLYPTSRSLWLGKIETPLPGVIKTLLKSDLVKADLWNLVEGSMNEIFDVDGGGPIGFTTLGDLRIGEMKSMSFISDSCSDASFSKLRTLNVNLCERLKFLFSYSIAQSLLQLETLEIFGCGNLERIIAETEEEEGGASSSSSRSSHTQPIIAFPNLRAGEITFPKLKSLTLINLPSFKRLCSETSSVNMPCLEELRVYRCPMMENLSTDRAAYGLKSAPKLKFLQVNDDILKGESIQKVWSGN